jgi:hypothetical protein
MAINPLPLIALAGAALLLMKSGEEDDATTPEKPDDKPDTTGFGIACKEMLGIYELRTAANPLPALDPEAEMRGGTDDPTLKLLPLSLDAFQKLRQFLLSGLEAGDATVLIDSLVKVSKGRPTGASTSGDLECGWVVTMSRDESPSEWSAKQKEVYKAAKTLMYRIACYNMFDVWHEPVGNNFPITKEFYDDVEAYFVNLKVTTPGADRTTATVDALQSIRATQNCAWLSPADAPIPYSDRMTDVYRAVEEIFTQVFE